MEFDSVEPGYRAFVSDLLERFGFAPEHFHLGIAPGDEPFFTSVLPGYPGREGAAMVRYFESALRTFDIYRQLADHLGGFGALSRVLDFGSGHGRLTRSLRHRLEPNRIWACDIYPGAVAWQAETFGVNGLVSVTDPARFALAERHDIVFAASVFSHLPDGLFQAWLKRLYSLVAPGGVLAFSVHGAGFAPEGQEIGDAGIGYARWSESQTLDPAIYGMSYVTDAYVRSAIEQACGPAAARNVSVGVRALFESQDLYVVGGPERDVTGLELVATPIGSFAKTSAPGQWSGWGLEPNLGSQIERVELFIGDRRVATAQPQPGNTAVMGFFPGAPNVAVSWSFDRIAVTQDTVLRAEMTNSLGRKAYAYALATPDADTPLLRG